MVEIKSRGSEFREKLKELVTKHGHMLRHGTYSILLGGKDRLAVKDLLDELVPSSAEYLENAGIATVSVGGFEDIDVSLEVSSPHVEFGFAVDTDFGRKTPEFITSVDIRTRRQSRYDEVDEEWEIWHEEAPGDKDRELEWKRNADEIARNLFCFVTFKEGYPLESWALETPEGREAKSIIDSMCSDVWAKLRKHGISGKL